MNPGSIVQCRNRDWVLLPSEGRDVYLLRPLTGATDEVVAVHIGMSNLISGSLPEERVRSATFPPPSGGDQVGPADGIRGTWRLFGCARRLSMKPTADSEDRDGFVAWAILP